MIVLDVVGIVQLWLRNHGATETPVKISVPEISFVRGDERYFDKPIVRNSARRKSRKSRKYVSGSEVLLLETTTSPAHMESNSDARGKRRRDRSVDSEARAPAPGSQPRKRLCAANGEALAVSWGYEQKETTAATRTIPLAQSMIFSQEVKDESTAQGSAGSTTAKPSTWSWCPSTVSVDQWLGIIFGMGFVGWMYVFDLCISSNRWGLRNSCIIIHTCCSCSSGSVLHSKRTLAKPREALLFLVFGFDASLIPGTGTLHGEILSQVLRKPSRRLGWLFECIERYVGLCRSMAVLLELVLLGCHLVC